MHAFRSHRLAKAIPAIAAASLMSLALAACGGESDVGAAGEKTIKVGMVCSGITPLTAQIAINAKTFPEGLKTEKICFDAGSEAVQALIGGSLDVFMGSVEHILSTQAQGLPTKAYAGINNRAPYSLLTKADSKVKSVGDLDGKTVGVTSPGSLSDTILRAGAEENNLDYGSMRVIGAGGGTPMQLAIDKGQVAAGMLNDPQATEMVTSGNFRTVWEPKFDYASIVVVSNSKWVAKNGDTMRDFLQGLKDADDKAQADHAFAVKAIEKDGYKVSPEALKIAIEHGLAAVPPEFKVTEEVYASTVDTLMKAGVVKKGAGAPFDQVFDFSYLPNGS